MMSSGVAAAVLLIAGVILSRFIIPEAVSAQEVFSQMDQTLADRPVARVVLKNVVHGDHRMDLEVYTTDGGRTTYAHLTLHPVEGMKDRVPVNADLTFARSDGKAWLLIRKLSYDLLEPLAAVIPANGAVLIRWDVPDDARTILDHLMPLDVHLEDIKAFVQSLEQAVPDLTTQRLAGGQLILEGKMHHPEELNLNALRIALDVVYSADRLARSVSEEAREQMSNAMRIAKEQIGDDRSGDRGDMVEVLDVLSQVTSRKIPGEKADLLTDLQEGKLVRGVARLTRDSMLRIDYDEKARNLTRVLLKGVGQNKDGELSIDFMGHPFDRTLLDASRWAEQPSTRTLSQPQVLRAIMMGLTALPAKPR